MYIPSINDTIYKKLMEVDLFVLIKERKVFIKYMEVLGKVRNIIKNKFNSKLTYSKKYLKGEKE